MTNIQANGIRIEYDTFGDDSSPALILISGLSGQMILWDEALCRLLVDRGLYVIRFDNRDAGLSTKMDAMGESEIRSLMAAAWNGEAISIPYEIDDMADDAIGLLDGLDLVKFHVCGASMGGMIAQNIAIRYPDRVLSLISIASSTGNPDISFAGRGEVDPPPPMPVPHEREANIAYMVSGMRDLSGPGFPFDEKEVRKLAALCYDRSFYPAGSDRQLLAIIASGNRRPALEKLTIPALVIHGDSDPLVPVAAGLDTADAVPNAELLIIEGMGHDLPRGAWPRIVDVIAEVTGF